MKNVAIIAEGGGLHGGFIAGVLTALNTELEGFSLHDVKTFVVSSATVGGTLRFLSYGDGHDARKFWTTELATKKFIRSSNPFSVFQEEPVLCVDHLAYDTFKKRNPYDVEKILTSHQHIYFPIFNYDTRQIEFFTNKPRPRPIHRGTQCIQVRHMRDFDIYQLLCASNAIPVLYDRVVCMNGMRYIDGMISEPITLDIPETLGMKKIVITSAKRKPILTFCKYTCIGAVASLLFPLMKEQTLRRSTYWRIAKLPQIYERRMRHVRELEASGDLYHVSPHKKLGGAADNSLETLRCNFESGVEYVRNHKSNLEHFIHTS